MSKNGNLNKRIDDNIVYIKKYFKGVIKDNQQIYTKGGTNQKPREY